MRFPRRAGKAGRRSSTRQSARTRDVCIGLAGRNKDLSVVTRPQAALAPRSNKFEHRQRGHAPPTHSDGFVSARFQPWARLGLGFVRAGIWSLLSSPRAAKQTLLGVCGVSSVGRCWDVPRRCGYFGDAEVCIGIVVNIWILPGLELESREILGHEVKEVRGELGVGVRWESLVSLEHRQPDESKRSRRPVLVGNGTCRDIGGDAGELAYDESWDRWEQRRLLIDKRPGHRPCQGDDFVFSCIACACQPRKGWRSESAYIVSRRWPP